MKHPSYDEESSATKAVAQFSDLATVLLTAYWERGDKSHFISASPQAREVFSRYQTDIHERVVDGDLALIGSFAMRWAEIAWRIALSFHCAEHRDRSHLTPLNELTARNAVRVMKWFAHHQQGLLLDATSRAENARLAIALGFVNRSAGITARDLHRFDQKTFENVASARESLEQLATEGAITSEDVGRGRRYMRKRMPRS